MTSQVGQESAEFRLENNDERQSEENRQAPQNPSDDQKVENLRNEGEGEKNDCQPNEDAGPWVPRR